jgi:hypothetical protein
MVARIGNVVIDSAEPEKLAQFWQEALAYDRSISEPHFVVLEDPAGVGISIFLNQVPEPKAGKNRVHIDLLVSSHTDEVQRLQALGASQIQTFEYENVIWSIMTDPEGNEFCCAQHRSPGT